MMKKKLSFFVLVLVAVSFPVMGAQTGLWQFDGDLTAQVGSDSVFLGTPEGTTAFFGNCSDFGAPNVDASDEQVLYVRKFQQEVEGLVLRGNMPANGGGSYCNEWTLVFDYCTTNSIVDAFTAGFCSLWDTNPDPAAGTSGEFFMRQVTPIQLGAGGQAGGYYNALPDFASATQWHRFACVVDAQLGSMKAYVDGVLIGSYARNQLISTRPDGTYSLYTGTSGPSQGSLLMFCTGSNNYNGMGFVNSAALYDECLSSSQIAELGAASSGGIPAGVPTGDTTLVRDSEFIGYYTADVLATNVGDATNQWAAGGTWTGSVFGYIDYSSNYGGSINLYSPNHDWDDPYIDIETTGTIDVYNPIAVDSSLEAVVEFVPEFNPAGDGQFVEIMFTDAGLSWGAGSGASDVHFKFWSDFGGKPWVAASANPASDGTWLQLDDEVSSITSVVVHTTYDQSTTTWNMYYRVNTTEGTGVLREVPDGPMVKARTTTAFRIEAEQYWNATQADWDLYVMDAKIYNEVKTTAPECIVGETKRHSDFNAAAGTIAGDFFHPIGAGYVDSLYVPSPATHEYSGTAWEIFHPGTAVYPNSNINFTSPVTDSAEWQLAIDCNFTSAGLGQVFGAKVDGNPVSFFLVNTANTANLIFGEATDIYNPSPGSVAVISTPADQINNMLLILNYDSVVEEYNAYYSVNGGDLQMHPASGFSLIRGTNNGTKVELQWQVWGAATQPFSVAIDDYIELCGIVTAPPSSVADFWLHE